MKTNLVKSLLIQGFIVFALLLGTTVSKGQVYFGVNGGALSTNLNGDVFGNNYKFGYTGGLTLGISMGDVFSIETGANYSLKGFSQKYTKVLEFKPEDTTIITTKEYNNQLDLTYVEAPLLFKFSISLGHYIKPYDASPGPVDIDFFFGPYVGYLLNVGQSSNTKVTEEHKSPDEGIKPTINEYSVSGGTFGIREVSGKYADYVQESEPGVIPERSLTRGLNFLDYGVMAGAGLSFEVGSDAKLFVHGTFSKGFATIDNTYFNDIKVVLKQNILDPTDLFDIKRTQKNITHQTAGARVGYIVYF